MESGSDELMKRLEQAEGTKLRFKDELEQQTRQVEELRRTLNDKSEQVKQLAVDNLIYSSFGSFHAVGFLATSPR
jgi:predicted RNase H-like nuclease (RuvC/YqgF family)